MYRTKLRSSDIRERIGELLNEADAIVDKADAEQRSLNQRERARLDEIIETVGTRGDGNKPATGLNGDAERHEQLEQLSARNSAGDSLNALGQRRASAIEAAYRDAEGRPVYALAPHQMLADLYSEPSPAFGMGEMIRAMVTGRKPHDERVLAALSEGSTGGGGVLVPERIAANIIDAARARSVTAQAGATTVAMDAEVLRMARVKTDPTMTLKAENAAFTATDVVFDSVTLNAHTIGCLIEASRELAEDAPNFSQQVEMVLANALAAELDRQFLVGDASAELTGIANDPNRQSTSSVGAISWEEVATGVVDLWGQNFEPNAYVASPTIAGDLDAITSGDGANSAKLWLGPPPPVEPLTRYVTSNVPNSTVIIGDFTQLVIGMRQEPLIEVSTQAENAFSKHQVLVKVTWRGDCQRLHSNAFHTLDGVTT